MVPEENVIRVNGSGKKIGIAGKTQAHEKGFLHRAFSIFIFNDNGLMLLQKRAATKYHFAGLWTNACCSHPRPGEKVKAAANRRLHEELGFTTPLVVKDHILYSFHDEQSNLFEHEFDHILTGRYNGEILWSRNEVSSIRWISPDVVAQEIMSYPQRFTPWFKLIMHSCVFQSGAQ
jgi:isopentenyl-diphosphate delta-isomerase